MHRTIIALMAALAIGASAATPIANLKLATDADANGKSVTNTLDIVLSDGTSVRGTATNAATLAQLQSASGTVHSALISSNAVAMGASAATGTQARAMSVALSNALSREVNAAYLFKTQLGGSNGVAAGAGPCSTTNTIVIVPTDTSYTLTYTLSGNEWLWTGNNDYEERKFDSTGAFWGRDRPSGMGDWGEWAASGDQIAPFPMKAGQAVRYLATGFDGWASWDMEGSFHGPGTYLTGTASGFTAGTATVAQAALTIPLSGVSGAGTAAASNSAAFVASAGGSGTNTILVTAQSIGVTNLTAVTRVTATNIKVASGYIENAGNQQMIDLADANQNRIRFKAFPVVFDGTTTNLAPVQINNHATIASNLTVSGTISGNAASITNAPVWKGKWLYNSATKTAGAYVFGWGGSGDDCTTPMGHGLKTMRLRFLWHATNSVMQELATCTGLYVNVSYSLATAASTGSSTNYYLPAPSVTVDGIHVGCETTITWAAPWKPVNDYSHFAASLYNGNTGRVGVCGAHIDMELAP